jgi:hypothetical protein
MWTTSSRTARSSSSTSSPAAPCRAGAGRMACTRPSRPRKGCDPEREPDARLHHLPELLPPLRQAGRHDRHGRHRGLRVPADLRPGGGGHPHPPADDAQGHGRPGLPDPAEKFDAIIEDIATARSAASRCWWAPPPSRPPSICPACWQGRPASSTGAERQAARARGADRRPGGRPGAVTIATNMAGRGTDIVLGGNLEAELRARPDARPREQGARGLAKRHSRCWRPAACTSSAPSAMNRGASTTSCAAVPAVRAIRAQPLLPVAGRQPDAHLRLRAGGGADAEAGHEKGEAIEHPWVTKAIENAQRKVEGTTSTSASSCSNSTTWPTISAR